MDANDIWHQISKYYTKSATPLPLSGTSIHMSRAQTHSDLYSFSSSAQVGNKRLVGMLTSRPATFSYSNDGTGTIYYSTMIFLSRAVCGTFFHMEAALASLARSATRVSVY